MDQGSVLVVGNLAEYKDASELGCDVLAQPEVVPRQLLLRLISQEPIYPT
jgi:hypothetical protein